MCTLNQRFWNISKTSKIRKKKPNKEIMEKLKGFNLSPIRNNLAPSFTSNKGTKVISPRSRQIPITPKKIQPISLKFGTHILFIDY